jgi:hypothetical protein
LAQQALQQGEVGRISETQPSELPDAEPLDGVVLLWLHVRNYSAQLGPWKGARLSVDRSSDLGFGLERAMGIEPS